MCMGKAAAHGTKRPHAREVLFDALSLLLMGKEKNLKGMSEAAVHGAKKPYAREVLFDMLSLLPIGREKNLESIGEASIHRAKSLQTKENNIMPVLDGWIL